MAAVLTVAASIHCLQPGDDLRHLLRRCWRKLGQRPCNAAVRLHHFAGVPLHPSLLRVQLRQHHVTPSIDQSRVACPTLLRAKSHADKFHAFCTPTPSEASHVGSLINPRVQCYKATRSAVDRCNGVHTIIYAPLKRRRSMLQPMRASCLGPLPPWHGQSALGGKVQLEFARRLAP